MIHYLKGSVKIRLPKVVYQPGEKVAGALLLKARKDIEVEQVNLYLKALKIKHKSNSAGSRGSREMIAGTLYQDEVTVVEDKEEVPAGTEKEYDFEFTLPEQSSRSKEEAASEEDEADSEEDGDEKTLNYRFFKKLKQYSLQWTIEGWVKCSGLDFYKVKNINVKLDYE